MTDRDTHQSDEDEPPQTRSISWNPPTRQTTSTCRRTAFFRRTSAGWILQHIRSVTLRQRGESTSELDPDARPIDLPLWVREEMGLEASTVRGRTHA
ncbi:hypothetical protein [Haloarcula onubensis]|uniref:Uncharacterized protein n=1 Tax=Haloarcula onubensis TaxID=2950539 RepID=A0ABU2FVE5_9EURY|nr:hypothetical protein [Halomicroarcula sp. S3CR25-11]MDS0284743.1 hypothetical protein [Halomicroarcula sp. S3CR25-11]